MGLSRTQYSQEFRDQSVKFFKESGLTSGRGSQTTVVTPRDTKELDLC